MKLVFVYWGYENAGSMLDLRGLCARGAGHGPRGHRLRPAEAEVRARLLAAISPAPTRSSSSFEWTTAAAVRRPARLVAPALLGAAPAGAS